MKGKVLKSLAAVVALVAAVIASSASAFIIYQPKTPKCLTK